MNKIPLEAITRHLPRFIWMSPLLCGLPTYGQTFPEADITYGTVDVDASIDPIWETVPANSLTEDIDSTSPADEDFSGYWKAVWDETNLYFLFVTKDDLTVPNPGSNWWNFDMVELFIDPDNSKGSTYDGINDSQFVWSRYGDSAFAHTNPLNIAFPNTENALDVNDGMVVIETAFPWTAFGITPEAGLQMGVDVYMKDNDTTFLSRDHALAWSPSADNAWRNASLLGTITLVESAGNSWRTYSVDANGWADTGTWLGWVNVIADPWIWVAGISNFSYIGDDSGWIYVPKL